LRIFSHNKSNAVFEKNRSEVQTLTPVFSAPVPPGELKKIGEVRLPGPYVGSETQARGSLGDPPTGCRNFDKREIG